MHTPLTKSHGTFTKVQGDGVAVEIELLGFRVVGGETNGVVLNMGVEDLGKVIVAGRER